MEGTICVGQRPERQDRAVTLAAWLPLSLEPLEGPDGLATHAIPREDRAAARAPGEAPQAPAVDAVEGVEGEAAARADRLHVLDVVREAHQVERGVVVHLACGENKPQHGYGIIS